MALGPQVHSKSVGSLATVQIKKYQLDQETHVSVMWQKESKNTFVEFVTDRF